MRALLTLSVVALGFGCGDSGDGTTSLTINLWPDGRPGPSRTATLRCDPPRGTLARPDEACAALERLEDPFDPVPGNVACTQIYGGPAEALVEGTYRGEPVSAEFDRTDGCQIARWDAHAFLFPG